MNHERSLIRPLAALPLLSPHPLLVHSSYGALAFKPGEMFHTLSKLVSFRTIADDSHREECRQGAGFLKRVLRGLGGETHLVRFELWTMSSAPR